MSQNDVMKKVGFMAALYPMFMTPRERSYIESPISGYNNPSLPSEIEKSYDYAKKKRRRKIARESRRRNRK